VETTEQWVAAIVGAGIVVVTRQGPRGSAHAAGAVVPGGAGIDVVAEVIVGRKEAAYEAVAGVIRARVVVGANEVRPAYA